VSDMDVIAIALGLALFALCGLYLVGLSKL
jgi:hypothetical protein